VILEDHVEIVLLFRGFTCEVLADHAQVIVLDRVLVGVELERAVGGLEFSHAWKAPSSALLVFDPLLAPERLDRGVIIKGSVM
jgi:hypothetical protein